MEWVIGFFIFLIFSLVGDRSSRNARKKKHNDDYEFSEDELKFLQSSLKSFDENQNILKRATEKNDLVKVDFFNQKTAPHKNIEESKKDEAPPPDRLHSIAKKESFNSKLSANDNLNQIEKNSAVYTQKQGLNNFTNQAGNLDFAVINDKKSTAPSPALIFRKHGVRSLWHITHRKNLKSIIQHGILCNKDAYIKFQPLDISNHQVQRWRDRIDPFHGRAVHEYAPLYIEVKNPMLYVKKDLNDELCLIEVSLAALDHYYFIFTNGNAASRDTKFFENIDDINAIPWDVLRANYWNDFPDGKRKRCTEVLIYPSIDPSYIINIHCFSLESVNFARNNKINVKLSKDLFF